MNVTSTGIAVALAVFVAFGFFVFGVVNPFESSDSQVAAVGATTTNNDAFMVTDAVVGTGAEAKPGDKVTVNYVGMLENGQVFDASENHGQPFSFVLGAGAVIAGWDQGIVGMKVGGQRHLVLPPELAYGSQAVGNVIPANSTLIFDVELVSITPAQ